MRRNPRHSRIASLAMEGAAGCGFVCAAFLLWGLPVAIIIGCVLLAVAAQFVEKA